jgi:hypothetical protein
MSGTAAPLLVISIDGMHPAGVAVRFPYRIPAAKEDLEQVLDLAESEGFEPSRNFWSLHP